MSSTVSQVGSVTEAGEQKSYYYCVSVIQPSEESISMLISDAGAKSGLA